MKTRLLLVSLLGPATLAFASEPAPALTASRILEHVRVLSSDEFEGRAPGSLGEDKTVAYLVDEFKKLGLAPGNPDGTCLQNVPLVGFTSAPTLTFTVDGRTLPMENINEFVGRSSRLVPHVAAKDTEIVFGGCGRAPPGPGWAGYQRRRAARRTPLTRST